MKVMAKGRINSVSRIKSALRRLCVRALHTRFCFQYENSWVIEDEIP